MTHPHNILLTTPAYALLVAALSVIFILAPFMAFAQVTLVQDPGEGGSTVGAGSEAKAAPVGTVDCFDHYSFGSVQVPISPQVGSAVSGTPITFTGEVVNNNPYPIVDGVLYVKIFRLRDDSAEKSANGPHVVDQFFVLTKLSLPAHGSLPIEFAWDIPSYAGTGEYQAATFFTTSKKYNLLGLSFTDDVVGNTANFSVLGERDEIVYFDKDSVTVNDKDYFFAAFPPRVDPADPVTVTAYIRNDTNQDVHAPVTWRLHQWDAQRRENLIETIKGSVVVKAGESAPVGFTTAHREFPVYLLEGEMHWRNTKSVVNVRFVREGVDRTRINFPAVDTYPLIQGEPATIFSCLHNVGNASAPGGELELRLVDERGKTIHKYTYTGAVTSAMMGVAEEFTPNRDYATFTLEARLYQDGVLVDDAFIVYDCNDIDPNLCMPAAVSLGVENPMIIFSTIGGVAGALIILVILFHIRRRVEKDDDFPQVQDTPPDTAVS